MKIAAEILHEYGIKLPSTAPGRYYATCPQCSASRSNSHRGIRVLGVTIDARGVHFGCNHCDFKGGEYFGKANGHARSDIVVIYDYVDENGELLFQVCRKANKSFPQRRPDGNGGWIWGTKGVRKVLYRLPEVIEAIASGHPILIVEGEKDANAAWKIGLSATCNPGGASEPGKKTKWRAEYSETLRDADIVILPDHDGPGYTHAESVARMCSGIAKRVRVLKLAEHWPEVAAKKGGDLSDGLAAGHTREELDALIEAAPETSSEEPPAASPHASGGGSRGSDRARARLDYETLIREGAPPGEDRSELFHSVVSHLASQALSPDEIVAKLKEHPNGIAAEFINRLDDEVRRSYKKWGAHNGIKFEDFRAYMPTHMYIYVPSREMWTGASVNARLPRVPLLDKDGTPVLNKKDEPIEICASEWLDKNRPAEMMTWCPGMPMLICNRLVSDGGWIEHTGVSCFNLYRPPTIKLGNAAKAEPWIDLVNRVYPDDAEHIIKWFSHRVQRPGEKINHAIVMGGDQGIGKDTILESVKRAVGPWNFQEVSPQQMLGRFNGFLKSVILRLSEARDLGDVNRFQFYDHTKAYTAAPPDVLRVDEKHLREYAIFNCVGVVITTNHKADGIFLPPDDRRHYVAWSECKRADFDEVYWKNLWTWYDNGGDRHVAAYLATLDLTNFNPKAPPRKTPAFWEIVDASRAPEDAELRDVLDCMGNPDSITIDRIARAASPYGDPERGSIGEWIRDRKNRRVIPHRLEEAGYVPVRNTCAEDGLWKISGKRQAVYARKELSVRDRIRAANTLQSV